MKVSMVLTGQASSDGDKPTKIQTHKLDETDLVYRQLKLTVWLGHPRYSCVRFS